MRLGFNPAVSRDALKTMGATVRAWLLDHRTGSSEHDLARMINPVVRGWMQYYGAFYRSALYCLLARINAYLMRWSRNKYKRLRNWQQAGAQWERAVKLRPRFFSHWVWVTWVPPVW
ncbi:MAG TPA: group II intron maturase-specific domain-containing protein [Actinocrinis sp.]|nr:group II intron maturase-specific domain-containing protein [Actinocrinis sp.]